MAVVNNLTTLKVDPVREDEKMIFFSNGVDDNFIKKTAEMVLLGEKSEKKDLSIALVGEARIKSLNWKYRRKNRTTDVLTFPDLDILICPMVVKDNAKKAGSTFKAELARVVIHGVLHWLGYEHEKAEDKAKEMRKREERYLGNII